MALTGTYIYLDRACPGWDQAWYLQVSTQLFYALRDGGLPAFVDVYVHAFTIKAPLVSVLPLPFYALFGPTEDAALLVNLVWMVALQAGLYGLGAALYGRRRALWAVAIFSLLPLTLRLRHEVLVEYGLAALVVLFVYALWRSDGLRRRGWELALGARLGLGLLMKVSFPAYTLAPAGLIVIWRLRDDGRRAWRRLPLDAALVLLPGLALAATWYAFNWRAILIFAHSTSWGEIAHDYSIGPALALDTIGRYWQQVINESFSVYVALLCLLLAGWALLHRRRAGKACRGLTRPQTLVLTGSSFRRCCSRCRRTRPYGSSCRSCRRWRFGWRPGHGVGAAPLGAGAAGGAAGAGGLQRGAGEATTTQLYVGGWAVVPERDMLSFYPNARCARVRQRALHRPDRGRRHALAAIAGGRQYGGL